MLEILEYQTLLRTHEHDENRTPYEVLSSFLRDFEYRHSSVCDLSVKTR